MSLESASINIDEITFEKLMKQKLKKVAPNQDTRPSSPIYNTMVGNSAETAQMYEDLKRIEDRTYGDTATGKDLDRRAGERGIVRYSNTQSILKGIFTKNNNGVHIPFNVPIGSRFSGEDLNYIAVQKIADGEFKMICETSGEAGNRYFGRLTPIDYIHELATAELVEILIPGEDTETDEHLRERYNESFGSQAFGGNIADYKKKTNSIAGVGSTKVYSVWNGGGTVKLVILDSTYNSPSDELITKVQTLIDPEGNQGKGLGLAPIGHVVTVFGAKSVQINISTKLTFQGSTTFESAKENIKQAIEEYFEELHQKWDKWDNIIIRISHIEMRILNITGILDIESTKINGNAENLMLSDDEIPLLNEVTNS